MGFDPRTTAALVLLSTGVVSASPDRAQSATTTSHVGTPPSLDELDPTDPAAWTAALRLSGLPGAFAAAAERRAASSGWSDGGRRGIREQGRRNARDEDGIPEDASELRGCNEVIGVHTVDEIKEVGNAIVLGTLPAQFAPVAGPVIEEAIKFQVRSRKICASCGEVMEIFGDELGLMDTAGLANGFLSYCGPDVDGHDAVFSGLLLEPIEAETGLPPVGKVKGTVWAKGSETDEFRVPSERWPASVSDVTGSVSTTEEIQEALVNYLDLVGPLMGATSGTYAFVADEKGFGEDFEGSVGYLIKRTYQTSFVPLWLYTKQWVRASTNGCTVLDDTASLAGYSAGGYAAVANAAALHALGVNVIRVSTGGGPYRMSSAFPMGTIELLDNGKWPSWANALPAVLGYAYSSTDPHLPNTNAGQNLLADEWMDKGNYDKNVIAWIDDGLGRVEILPLMPENPLDIYNQGIISLFRNANNNDIPYPCITEVEDGVNDKFCAALLENDLTELLETSTYPIQFCHSPDDDMVSVKNLPNMTSNKLLTKIIFPEPTGNHLEANFICTVGSLIPLTTFGGDPTELAGIDPPDNEGCYTPGANTVPPVAAEATSPPTPMPQEQADPTPAPQEAAGTRSSAGVMSGGFGVTLPLFALLLSLRW